MRIATKGARSAVLVLLAAAACHPATEPGPIPTDVLALPPFDGSTFACQDAAPDPAGCADLALAYAAAAQPGLDCNPDASELCNAPRPAPSTSAADGGAPPVVCSCPVYVSPPHSAPFDAALAHFLQAGCHVRCCACPPGATPHACRPLAPSTGTCG